MESRRVPHFVVQSFVTDAAAGQLRSPGIFAVRRPSNLFKLQTVTVVVGNRGPRGVTVCPCLSPANKCQHATPRSNCIVKRVALHLTQGLGDKFTH